MIKMDQNLGLTW